MADTTPRLREITPNQISQLGNLPTTRIKTDDDVTFWKSTQSYLDYKIFLGRLNEAVAGHSLPWKPDNHTQVSFFHRAVFAPTILDQFLAGGKNVDIARQPCCLDR